MLMAFLHGRLSERPIIEWALRSKPHEIVKRVAVLQSLEFLDAKQLKEPWRSAWRLIEESWDQELPQSSGIDAYRVQRRIAAGERSGSLISAIIALVQPRLEVDARSERPKAVTSKRPRRVEDLFHASLSSQKLADLDIYRLDSIDEVDFLTSLGIAIEGAVNYGIALGRRLGWEGDHKFWRIGQLHYVGYQVRNEDGYNWDVDKFHDGIAPSVKLLDAVVKRIGALDPGQARAFVSRWKQMSTPIHLRLWASLSQVGELTSADELTEALPALEDRPFWDIHAFPEIAELRALRFDDVAEKARNRMVARIKRGPPRTFWPRGTDRVRVKGAQQYWAARELRRIEVAGSRLPASAASWLAGLLDEFQELRNMNSIQFGFLTSGTARWVKPEPDDRFNDLVGEALLRALEGALASASSSWSDDPAERASDWIRSGDNASLILSELEAARDGGAEFPNTWDRFGWSHNPPNRDNEGAPEHRRTGDRVLALLELLPAATVEPAIQGITHWISSWERVVTQSPTLLAVWIKLWPIAVAATNETTDETDTIDLNQIVGSSPEEEPSDLDTLNTATGRLVGVFLASCPTIQGDENPFERNEPLRVMRDSIIAADGKSGLIGRHRLIEELPYFLKADEEWAKRNLVAPLAENDAESLALWRAIARRTQFTKVLEVIGHQFADRATDRRLGRETRSSLLSSLVLESLHAFREGRDPVIANAKVQQTLRAADDEVRANAAQTVQRFLSWMSTDPTVRPRQSADEIFRLAIAPFLENVWPQERSLATRGVSAAFADLPAAAGRAFSEAVDAVERFLVPFDCWSMSDFGLGGDVDGTPRLAFISTPEIAAALLRLLNISIGTAEGSVVPMDLAEALDQIRSAAGRLVQDSAFRRLETVARRR
ncbi:hypothetical protein ABB30_01680 [Stenotrophomonas ginsengisoli]|uniref:Uncharacterized protein n=2 Tax=Stenotrophomonas ginsengisoli TaxID=336566 RepID=A0A0R0DM84_9GAMM|nr:hypothetical protein ABB30_01680 [Stenotrophomonas ginsengisoli]